MGNYAAAGGGTVVTCGPAGGFTCGPVGVVCAPSIFAGVRSPRGARGPNHGQAATCVAPGEGRPRCPTEPMSQGVRSSYPQRYDYPGVDQYTPRNAHLEDVGGARGAVSSATAGGGVAPSGEAGALGSPQSDFEGPIKAQQLVKNFVQNIYRGIPVTLLPDPGGATKCVVSLDRKLNTMSLQQLAGGCMATRKLVPLEHINSIVIGDEFLGDEDLPATEMCVTLFLEGGKAVTLEFPDLEERDTFALCLSMFVAGRQREVDDYV